MVHELSPISPHPLPGGALSHEMSLLKKGQAVVFGNFQIAHLDILGEYPFRRNSNYFMTLAHTFFCLTVAL